jgi:hypothetical protein
MWLRPVNAPSHALPLLQMEKKKQARGRNEKHPHCSAFTVVCSISKLTILL